MIPIPTGVRVWLATGHTDMRCGFPSLALRVQEVLKRDAMGGGLFCFRGKRGDLLKVIWHDGQGACLFTKRLERGRFIWPSVAGESVTSATLKKPSVRRGSDSHFYGLNLLLDLIQWLHDIEAGRSSIGPCECPGGAAGRACGAAASRGGGCQYAGGAVGQRGADRAS
ncbi:IS66 family insertion sequence element accessory protein TnpB [Bradyrhizobium sp. 186]|uniref:IS66 family insertion sequence element accessory protein TnpB n=2 Tax=Pseudomonadota TaxID=1224 RepID=UPI0032119853